MRAYITSNFESETRVTQKEIKIYIIIFISLIFNGVLAFTL